MGGKTHRFYDYDKKTFKDFKMDREQFVKTMGFTPVNIDYSYEVSYIEEGYLIGQRIFQ